MIKTIGKKWQKLAFLYVMVLSLGTLIGCASSSGSGSTPSSGNLFSGNASISGSVIVNASDRNIFGSSGESSDGASVASSKPVLSQFSLDIQSQNAESESLVSLDSGTAVLYKVNEDGTTTDTGFSVSVTNGEYEFNGVSNGNMYLIEIIKKGESKNGQVAVIRQKGILTAPEGVLSVKVDQITPETGFIVESIIANVVKLTGTAFLIENPDKFTEFIDKTKTLIIELSREGRLDRKRVSLISESDSNSIKYEGGSEIEIKTVEEFATKNDDFKNTIEKINIGGKMKDAVDGNLTVEESKNFIRKVFGVSQQASKQQASDEDIPQEVSDDDIPEFFINGFADAYRNRKKVTLTQFSEAFYASLPEDVRNSSTSQSLLNKSVASINITLGKLYSVYDNEEKELKDEFKETWFDNKLPVLQMVFPSDLTSRWELESLQGSQSADVPQMIMLFGMLGLYEIELDPYILLSELGLIEFGDSVVIINSELRTFRYHNDTQNEFIHPLFAYVDLYIPEEIEIPEVELIYNDTNGISQQKSFIKTQEDPFDSEDKETHFRIFPWSETEQPVTDYASGEVTIRVIDSKDKTTVLASKTHTVYRVDISDIDFHNPQDKYDTDENDNAYPLFSLVEPTIHDIPSGHSLKYAISIRLKVDLNEPNYGDCRSASVYEPFRELFPDVIRMHGNSNSCYFELYSSWESQLFISSSDFETPIALPKLLNSYTGVSSVEYNINARPVVVNDTTQEVIWEGNRARHSFIVGAVDWIIPVSGSISFSNYFASRLDSGYISRLKGDPSGEWKIGLFLMGYWDNTNQKWKDIFWDQSDTTPREPVKKLDGTPLVTSLGPLSIAKGTSEITISGFPSIEKSDKSNLAGNPPLIEKHYDYKFIIWYDQSGTIPNPKGGSDTITLVDGKIDISFSDGGYTWIDSSEELNIYGASIELRRNKFGIQLQRLYQDQFSGEWKHDSQNVSDGIKFNDIVF